MSKMAAMVVTENMLNNVDRRMADGRRMGAVLDHMTPIGQSLWCRVLLHCLITLTHAFQNILFNSIYHAIPYVV